MFFPRRITLLSFLTLASLTSFGATPATLPTTDEIQDLIDLKQYPDALAKLARLLELKGPAAAPYDRHQLLLTKAECLLLTHDYTNALTTLATAQKESKDLKESFEPTALTILVKKSTRGIFTHPGDTDKLDITDKSQRAEAYKKLWADQLSILKAGVKSDKSEKSITPILDDIRAIAPQRAIEFMATGKSEVAEKLAQELKDRALKLLTKNLDQMNTKADDINQQANVTIRTIDDSGRVLRTRKTGLSFENTQALRDIESTCNQYPPVLKDLAQLFPPDEKTFATLNTRAATLQAHATKIRTTQY